jgi:hypothetical protein
MIVTEQVPYEIDWDTIMLPEDLRVTGTCNRGARAHFKERGWDWARFVREGLPLREFGYFDAHMRVSYENAMRRLGR